VDALELNDVWARYAGQPASGPALAGVELRLKIGERLLIVGPNGAGKSTLIRVCSGLMRPSQGQISVMGLPVRHARGQIGVVSHTTFLYDELTALENLVLYGELYGTADARSRAIRMLQRIGLANSADVRVGHLSRGQQQRVALGRAFVHDPALLLLDEPDTSLDVAAFDVLERLVVAGTHSLLVTTHDLAAGIRLSTRLAVLGGGRIVEERARVEPSDAEPLTQLVRALGAGAMRR
jgi:ABC-type multidrug transport system ATPase subunit